MSKKYLLVLMLICFAAIAMADLPQPNIPIIRKQLIRAIDSKQITDSLYQSLGLFPQRTGVINAYRGALEALKAKHAWNPYYKIKYLNDAEDTFKQAVTQDPHNIEIRFMRFSVEHNVPGFLGYTKNLTADKEEMIRQVESKNYGTADQPLVIALIKFMLASKQCTSAELNTLNKQLAELK
ncbi:hypothetical protein [Mucilaginibacter agri]|uniref:Uncharacterized protein n=1 Tax=Mucilaginibacter agri TaxID=2695265 RepID=A0A965ZKK8_9SPHI|nr:hypothetical protein [Mucilaginibacter agri]NCD71371.1 hypothetical protein [Mucilaginibacter agri]